MICLNDYLYNGDTVLKIIKNYSSALREEAKESNNAIDMAHANFLLQIEDILIHNDFLTSQSQRIREFYKYMAKKYPFLAFTFKGRIKSLIRAENKFNGYIVSYVKDYFAKNGCCPDVNTMKNRLGQLHDLIAYRIVISLPKCHVGRGQDAETEELKYLYEIANILPSFLEERGFSAEVTDVCNASRKTLLRDEVKEYYRDYIEHPMKTGYKSLHITLFDNISRSHVEIQLRTKSMDDYAEIGAANHRNYEEIQRKERKENAGEVISGCQYYDEAYERGLRLQGLDLTKIDVNMFAANENNLVNDGCGLYRGRLILPFEHLSRFQNDRVD